MGDSPWANPQRYISNSPYYRIDRIRTPLLIVAGNKDTTVPSDEARRLFVGLRRMGRSAQLAIYPGEGHVISEWSIGHATDRSAEHTSELQSLMRISYAVFCLKKTNKKTLHK